LRGLKHTGRTGCRKTRSFVILSEAKNLSSIVSTRKTKEREILRFAQNDKINTFSAACEACATGLEETMSAWSNFQVWWRGLLAAAVAGGANGVITGFAAVGIDPTHFNLQAGLHSTLAIAAVSALMSGIIGVAAYLKQSPLPG
jgi:hypothetical protein